MAGTRHEEHTKALRSRAVDVTARPYKSAYVVYGCALVRLHCVPCRAILTGLAHARSSNAAVACPVRRMRWSRLWLWELLPDPRAANATIRSEDGSR
jgi:hypothetical protein